MATPGKSRYLTISIGFIFLFVLAGVLTLDDYGMGWDEITRWHSGDRKLEHYRLLLTPGESPSAQRMAGDKYPSVFDLPLATIHSVFGGNRMHQGHFLSILFGALGLASTGWLAAQVFGGRVAILSIAFLALYPRFYGHAMMNPKDIPFLATYTLGLAAGFALARNFLHGHSPQWRAFLLAGLAIGLAGSARIPGLSLLLVSVGLSVLALLHRVFLQREVKLAHLPYLRLFTGYGLTAAVTFLTVLFFFPRLQFELFSGIPEVASKLHSSANEMPLLFNGKVVDASEAPFAYPLRFFAIASPAWLLFFLAAGGLFLLRVISDKPLLRNQEQACLLFFLAATAFPWVYLLVMNPSIHDGLRHFLFAIPPLIIIAAYGADRILQWAQGHSVQAVRGVALALIAIAVFQVFQLWRMHPYQYVGFNLLAGERATLPNRYDTEYWCTSSRHLLEALPSVVAPPDEGEPPIKIRVSGALDSARSFVPRGFVLTDSFEEAAYYVSNTNFRIDTIVDGEVIYELRRGGIPIGVIKQLR